MMEAPSSSSFSAVSSCHNHNHHKDYANVLDSTLSINENGILPTNNTETIAPIKEAFLCKCETFELDETVGKPFCSDTRLSLTDFYQVTMAYANWKNGKENDKAVFEVYFRKCPFGGEFAVLAGVNEVLRFLNTFRFTTREIEFLRKYLPTAEDAFFDYLLSLNGSKITCYAINEGSIVFANEPLIRIEGPLSVCQLIETPILNLTNFSTLVATNAARYRLAAGWNKELLEFGARRAQGPNGAMSASRYVYMGGFDSSSNIRGGNLFGIPLCGTHSHAFISSFQDLSSLKSTALGDCKDFVALVLEKRQRVITLWPKDSIGSKISAGELVAFIAYAQTFPAEFLCLLDTFDTLSSGLPNFLSVALALYELGYKPIGIRLDSGDLAYLSKEIRKMFNIVSTKWNVPFSILKIVVSNNVNENLIQSLNEQSHEVDAFGIGTHLVTCQSQPALGMVYKLVELNGNPCMKLSQEFDKVTIPAAKSLYRLYNNAGLPVADLIEKFNEPGPQPLEKIFCRHLFDETKRCYVIPHEVEPLLKLIWDRGASVGECPSLQACRAKCVSQLQLFRNDHLRAVKPTAYKISASKQFYKFFRRVWSVLTPIETIS